MRVRHRFCYPYNPYAVQIFFLISMPSVVRYFVDMPVFSSRSSVFLHTTSGCLYPAGVKEACLSEMFTIEPRQSVQYSAYKNVEGGFSKVSLLLTTRLADNVPHASPLPISRDDSNPGGAPALITINVSFFAVNVTSDITFKVSTYCQLYSCSDN